MLRIQKKVFSELEKYIDGALVGGASLDPVEFGKICINYIHQMETQE